jgi:hypothetical protein
VDHGNNRLLLMDAAMHVVWRYPAPGLPRDPLRLYFPDDAFFTDHGTTVISNQEQNETIIKLAYPSGKIIRSFGHPGCSGTAPGYLNEPDDAYLLKDGQVTVADARNCRVLVINAHWCGSTASPASRAPGRGNSTPRMASTCGCRTARHRRTR